MKIQYDSTNSGGSWWLTDEDWYNLEAAGWEVEWERDKAPNPLMPRWGTMGDDRFLGALAYRAFFYGTMEEAIASWVAVTGQDPDEQGCPCCGQPHNFYEADDIIDTTGYVVDIKALPEVAS